MKKRHIFIIIIGGILVLLTIAGIVAYLITFDTYISNVRLEASSGYPPRLIQISDQGVVEETALLSIMPTLNIGKLSSYVHTRMSGTIYMDCGGDYQETQNFSLVTDNPGDSMRQNFAFKGIPSERVCSVVARVLECETELELCSKNTVSNTIRIP